MSSSAGMLSLSEAVSSMPAGSTGSTVEAQWRQVGRVEEASMMSRRGTRA